MTTTDTTTTKPAATKRPSSRDRARAADAAKLQTGLPGSKPLTTAQRNRALAVVPPANATGTPSAPAAKKTSASKPATPAKPKPAPKPAKPSIDKIAVVHSAMVRALADLAAAWDESTGVTAADAMKLISHRAGYMSPKAKWDSRLLPRHIHNGH